MIVPKAPPTSHFRPYWAGMIGFTVRGKLDLLPAKWRDWTKTITFDQPFDFYSLSAFEPMQWKFWEGSWNLLRFGNSSVDRVDKVGDKSLKIKGKIVDGWVDRRTMWVVVRAYSEAPPLRAHSFTVSGISNGTSITSGEKRTISVYVKSQNNTPIGGVRVRFIDSDDKEISFSRTSTTTDSSGVATTTLYTGSEGSADFGVEVDGLSRTSFRFNVVSWEKSFTRTGIYKGTWQTFCWKKRVWETWTRYVDVPPRTVKGSVSITYSYSEDANLKGWDWHDSDTIKLWGRIRQKGCWARRDWVRYEVSGRYKSTNGQRRIQGAPFFTPEQDTLSEYWSDLSQVPIETDLFNNYPNPFNPETWIPYQLATPAAVSVDIYAVDGHLVRRLSLGHQPAGVYKSKSRAAYWDGRNEVGERVASGLYFYTLTAGEFSATRKLLIRK